jgi:hypothetical protein
MGWVKIDDGFTRHPKVMKAGPLGIAMQVAALCYCNQYLTDGFIPRSVVAGLLNLEGIGMRMWDGELFGGGEDATWVLIVEDLIESGLWEEVEGGFQIHDYLDYQPSKAEVLAEREQKKMAGQKGGLVSAQARAQAKSKQVLEQNLSKSQAPTQAKSKQNSSPIPTPNPLPNPLPNPIPDQGCLTATAQSAAVAGNKPTNGELINELTEQYRAIEGIQPAKGDHSFIGALYNKHGYDRVLDAINELQMAAATQELKKPLLYLKGILEPRDKDPPGNRSPGGEKRKELAKKIYV